VCAFALRAEQAEEFHRFGTSGAEPVRYVSVELGRFAWLENQIMVTEDDPKPTVEHIEPFVTFVSP
jgi:hypothetical protein